MIDTVFGRRRPAFEAIAARARGEIPAVLARPKVALTVLAGIVLPLVALVCSFVILAEERRS